MRWQDVKDDELLQGFCNAKHTGLMSTDSFSCDSIPDLKHWHLFFFFTDRQTDLIQNSYNPGILMKITILIDE